MLDEYWSWLIMLIINVDNLSSHLSIGWIHIKNLRNVFGESLTNLERLKSANIRIKIAFWIHCDNNKISIWLRKALYLGSVKRWHWCSSEKDPPSLGSSKYKYYVLHLSKEPFPKNISDLEVVKTDSFSLMYPDFNVWKKVGNSYSTVSSCTQQ